MDSPTMTQRQPPSTDAPIAERLEDAVGLLLQRAQHVQSVLAELTDADRLSIRQSHNMFDVLTFAARDVRETADGMDSAANFHGE
jgi:hypothetical protein